MALRIDRFRDKDGNLYAGFFVKNRIGNPVALGASALSPFVFMTHKRYQNDKDMVQAVKKLTGISVELRHK